MTGGDWRALKCERTRISIHDQRTLRVASYSNHPSCQIGDPVVRHAPIALASIDQLDDFRNNDRKIQMRFRAQWQRISKVDPRRGMSTTGQECQTLRRQNHHNPCTSPGHYKLPRQPEGLCDQFAAVWLKRQLPFLTANPVSGPQALSFLNTKATATVFRDGRLANFRYRPDADQANGP